MTSTTRGQDQAAPTGAGLSAADLSQELLAGSRLYTSVRVLACTGSTNADLLAASAAGEPAGAVLVAEQQTSGRGRLGRSWQSRPGASLTFSVLLRPAGVPPASRGWLPLLSGVAVARAVRAQSGVSVSLKWPNDVLAGTGAQGKLAGILAEQAGEAIVVGIGLNVAANRAELPSDQATSLLLEGSAGTDRRALLIALLRELEYWYLRFTQTAAPGDPASSGVRAEYLRWCGTIGQTVRVELPGGALLAGRASGIDSYGRLLVSDGTATEAVSAGDVVHLRPAR